MLDHQSCEQLLNEGSNTYTEAQVKLISELLWKLAELTVETYHDLESK